MPSISTSFQRLYVFIIVGLTCLLPSGCTPETEESLLNNQNQSVNAELYRLTMSQLDIQIDNAETARQMSLMDDEMVKLVCFVKKEAISAIESNGMSVGPQMNLKLKAFTLDIQC